MIKIRRTNTCNVNWGDVAAGENTTPPDWKDIVEGYIIMLVEDDDVETAHQVIPSLKIRIKLVCKQEKS